MKNKGQLLTYELILTLIIVFTLLMAITIIENENSEKLNVEDYKTPSRILTILDDRGLLLKLSKNNTDNTLLNDIDIIVRADNPNYQLNDLSINKTIINKKKEYKNSYSSTKIVNKHTYQLIYFKN